MRSAERDRAGGSLCDGRNRTGREAGDVVIRLVVAVKAWTPMIL